MMRAASQLPQQEGKDDLILPLDAFVRSIGIKRSRPAIHLCRCWSLDQFRLAIGADVYLGMETQHLPHQQPRP